MTISIIAALGSRTRVIGKGSELLWKIPQDLRRFKKLTCGHPVVMGRKTWESLPEKFRPLPGRTNIIMTRDIDYATPNACVCTSLAEAIETAENAPGSDELFIIGGGEVYELALSVADRLYLTLVQSETPGDIFFPEYDHLFRTELSSEKHVTENGLHYSLPTWRGDLLTQTQTAAEHVLCGG